MTQYDFECKIRDILQTRMSREDILEFNDSKIADAYRVYRSCKSLCFDDDKESRSQRDDDELGARGISIYVVSNDAETVDIIISLRIQSLVFTFFDETARARNLIGSLCCCESVAVAHNEAKGFGDLFFTISECCRQKTGKPFICIESKYDETIGVSSWADRAAKELAHNLTLNGDIAMLCDGGDGVRHVFDAVKQKGFTLDKLSNVEPVFVTHSRGADYDISEIIFEGKWVEMPAQGVLAMLSSGCSSVSFAAERESDGNAEIRFCSFNKWDYNSRA